METEVFRFQQKMASMEYFIAASLGLIPGVEAEVKFGHCPDAAAVATDIWEYGATQALYIFPDSSGEEIEVVSSSGTDSQTVTVDGLDAAGLKQSVNVALNGLTPVAIPGVWTAVNRAYNSDSTKVIGDVWIRGNGTTSVNVFAVICPICQQTAQAIYVVPTNKVAVVINFSTSMNKPLGATVATIFSLQVELPGKVFRTQIRYGLGEGGTSNISSNLVIPNMAGPLTRLKIVADASAGPADVSGEFSMLLIDKELIPADLLAELEG